MSRPAQPGAQSCQARGCGITVAADGFMCPEHWAMVPPGMREVLSTGATAPGCEAIGQAAIAAVAHWESRGKPRGSRAKPVQLALFDLPA